MPALFIFLLRSLLESAEILVSLVNPLLFLAQRKESSSLLQVMLVQVNNVLNV
jgi:hypothetical protein